MTENTKHRTFMNWHRTTLLIVLCLFVLCLPQPTNAQGKGKKQKKKAEWVFLDHADDLSYDEAKRPGVQIAKGKVRLL